MKTVAGGDWSDGTKSQMEKAVAQYAEDFGYDLDEEGHPLDQDDETPPSKRSGSSDGNHDGDETSDGETSENEKEDEPVPA
jgi:hypothetical protein